MSKGPLNLVAITRLAESDSQLRSQLEALYMQILSTLTLPSMERMFAARANYDLRRPLQGTETLLSALADGFTRGSASTLLSALECLKLRKSQRTTINNTLLKTRSDNLLYGLIVASGKLVSVVRPKKHSLHPGDLHLIFNMLFEAGSVKAGGGENWIPLCLPGFNNTGYLYMYVSFLNLEHPSEPMQERPRTSDRSGDEVAVLLISAEKESFFELRGMRDNLVEVCRNFSLPKSPYCRIMWTRSPHTLHAVLALPQQVDVHLSGSLHALVLRVLALSPVSHIVHRLRSFAISASDIQLPRLHSHPPIARCPPGLLLACPVCCCYSDVGCYRGSSYWGLYHHHRL